MIVMLGQLFVGMLGRWAVILVMRLYNRPQFMLPHLVEGRFLNAF